MNGTEKAIGVALNAFDVVPPTLASTNPQELHASEISLRLTDVLHHMFRDSFGYESPNEDPYLTLYAPMFITDTRLRVRGGGLGSHKEVKIGEYNRFGKAFCRWFLDSHCDIIYFAHLDQVLGVRQQHGQAAVTVTRRESGDIPDYLCTNSTDEFFLAEAKGTGKAISFTNQRFERWREQFTRVECVDEHSVAHSLKGYIVATRLVSEKDSLNIRSTIFAEDPYTRGDIRLADAPDRITRQAIVRHHYSDALHRLRMPALAHAIASGFRLPEDYTVRVGIWECLVESARGRKFVGGFYTTAGTTCQEVHIWPKHPLLVEVNRLLCLSRPEIVFFGIELDVFRALKQIAIRGPDLAGEIRPVRYEGSGPENLSVLPDATIWADLDYFRLVSVEQL